MARGRYAFTLGFLVALWLLVPIIVQAHPPEQAWAPFHLALEDVTGRPLPTFRQHGRTFVLGRLGQAYRVRIHNQTGRRVEAVLSVDGRDAVSGRPGDYRTQRGYLIEPYGDVVVTGFRQTLNRVAAFRFTTPGDSYSARMETPENVGVIGVALFVESQSGRAPLDEPVDEHRWRAPPRAQRYGGSAKRHRAAPDATRGRRPTERDDERRPPSPSVRPEWRGKRNNLGTQYGESEHSAVYETRFRRAHPTEPDAILSLRYDDEAGLRARGIDPYRWWRRPSRPDPFPDSRFAPPPP